MVAIKQQLVSRTNRISKGTNSIKYITIHETANTGRGANAQAHANLQSNGNSREASWHYSVDDKQVIQSFKDTAICWHAGKGNSQSIGIEICVNSDGDFNKAVDSTVALVRLLMARHKLDASKVVQHNYWTGKDCPHYLRSGKKGVNWNQFKEKLKGDVTVATNYEKNAKPSPSLAAEFKKAVDLGITDGTYPKRPATREEVAVMIVRALGKK